MPKNRPQKLLFMLMTVFLSVILFVIYNVALHQGSMTNQVFRIAAKEIPLEFAIAFLVELLIAYRLSQKIAFRIVDPRVDRPVMVMIAITCSTILIMCPTMSFAATVIYDGITVDFFANWMQKIAFNFPFAFFIQLFCRSYRSETVPVISWLSQESRNAFCDDI